MPLLTSVLNDRHMALGAKFAEFSGWSMPLNYTAGIVTEHRRVRSQVGIFDVSHLGNLFVRGPGAVDFLNACLANDLHRIGPGRAQYTLCCNANGGVVDDLIAYVESDDDVMLIPNAANTEVVGALLGDAAPSGIDIVNRQRDFAIIAVQGPESAHTLEAVGLPNDLKYMSFEHAELAGGHLTVCRTGYTGERGYELVVPVEHAVAVWDEILAAGKEYDILPAGLGARDTLRTEMGYALHGHELSPTISPVEAGVSWAVGWKKETFWGADVLRAQRENGAPRRARGLKAVGHAIPRPGMRVQDADGRDIGEVTSGTFSPTLECGVALALLDAAHLPEGKAFVVVRGRPEEFEVTEPPFVTSNVR